MQNEYLSNAVFEGGEKENLPLLENKLPKGTALIYVCKDKVCKMPVESVGQALIH